MARFMLIFVAAVFVAVAAAEEPRTDLTDEEIMYGDFSDVASYANDDRTIDQIIEDAGTKQGAALAAGENQEINYDMDMNMDPIQYETNYGKLQGFSGAGMANGYYRWPKNIIPYQITGRYTQSQLNSIYAGMQMWQQKTCIRFVPCGSSQARSTGHNHCITIFSGQGCYSSVGYNHRSHQVSLQAGGCTYPGIAAHELGHTIGLHHEQCRPDRDNYVRILLNNVPSNMRYNFNKVSGTSTFGQPYDYCSIMHYGATAFGGRSFTIVPKDFDYIGTIGMSNQGGGLTKTDADIVNKMYSCGMSAAYTSCPRKPCTTKWSSSTCSSLQRMVG